MRTRKCLLSGASVLLALAMLSGCGGSSGKQVAPSQPAAAALSESDQTKSAYDQIMAILADPAGDVLPLSGVQPIFQESRAGVYKGLDKIKPKDKVVIGWAAASMGSSFFEGLMRSAKQQAAKYGYELRDVNADFNLATQQQQVDAFITQRVDVLVMNAVDLHSSTQDIRKAVNAGIPVFVTGPTAAKAEYQIITAVISGSNESGFQVGQYVAEQLYKPGNVLKVGMTISKLPDADSNSRPAGFIAGFLSKKREKDGNPYPSKYDAILAGYNAWKQYKANFKHDLSGEGLNFVALGVGDSTAAEAGQRASAEILTAHPDMDLIVVEMDSQAIGVIQEVKQHNLVPGKDIKIVTCADGTRESLEYIKSGELMATATNIPYYNSQGIIDIIHRIYSEGFDANNMPATSFTPTEVISIENVDKYYDPNEPFAKLVNPWSPITIDEYNTIHAND
ncbi:MAG: sugar ABC transporter substrate-binding protein [Treponema sp.]|jgi:ribose transport system substrate-binding protein|nr:sugar ABC transporter substrate-binding protein [Treponema sp.]